MKAERTKSADAQLNFQQGPQTQKVPGSFGPGTSWLWQKIPEVQSGEPLAMKTVRK